jgi:hypothetical protein
MTTSWLHPGKLAEHKGKKYSMNYKEARVDWQSPLERSPAKQKAEEKQN